MEQVRLMTRFAVFILMILMPCVVAGGVDAAGLEKKRNYGARKEGQSHIQLRSMMAPVALSPNSKQTTNSPVTVIMTVVDSRNVGKICNKAPRINDALMGAWYQTPIRRDYLYDRKDHKGDTNVNYRRTKAQQAEDARLLKVINEAIGGNEIIQILVVGGIIKMGGGAVTKLPFSSVNGCDELE